MTTLRETCEKGELDQFIEERDAEAKGDAYALNRAFARWRERAN